MMVYKIKFYGKKGFVRYGNRNYKTKREAKSDLVKARKQMKERNYKVKAKIIKR